MDTCKQNMECCSKHCQNNICTCPTIDTNKELDDTSIRKAVDIITSNKPKAIRATEKEYGNIEYWNVGNVTDMKELFEGKHDFNSDLSCWDVSLVTNMSEMFRQAKSFNSDVSNWDVSHVTDMKLMFNGAKSFNSILSSWNVSQVADMWGMFDFALSFNQNLSNWDVSQATDMDWMFSFAQSFNQTLCWDVAEKSTDYMFADSMGCILRECCRNCNNGYGLITVNQSFTETSMLYQI